MAKRIMVYKINEEIGKMQNSFLQNSPTEQQFFKQTFARIITQEGKNKGKIKTYTSAIRDIKKYAPETLKKSPYTYEDYKREVTDLKDLLKDRLTLEGEIDFQRGYMERYIEDNLFSNIDTSEYNLSDFKSLSTEDILEAFREAEKMQREAKNKSYDSGRFYEYLAQAIQERLY